MNRLRTFLTSLNILNGLLTAAVAAVIYFGVVPLLDPTMAVSLPRANPSSASAGQPAALPMNVSPADFAVISDQNLFHPERRIPPEKQPEKVIPKPDLFLYGTLITDEGSFAFIEDKKTPYSTAGRGKRQTTLKKGDSLQGYVLRDIQADRIVLVKGEDKLVVMLNDAGKRRAAETQAGAAAPGTAPGGVAKSQSPGTAQPAPAARASASAVGAPRPGKSGGVIGSRLFSTPAGAASPATDVNVSGSQPQTRRERVEAGKLMRLQQMRQQIQVQ
jgi:hypothetical protein